MAILSIQNVIVSEYDEGRIKRFLVKQSEEQLELQKSEWLTLYWGQQDVLMKVFELLISKATLPKRKRNL
jgi:hypothetical protein